MHEITGIALATQTFCKISDCPDKDVRKIQASTRKPNLRKTNVYIKPKELLSYFWYIR